MSLTFFGLLRLGQQNTAEPDLEYFPEHLVPPITQRILAGMPQELTEQSCTQRLKQIAADYGYGIETGFEHSWSRQVTDLLLNSGRRFGAVSKKLMTQVVLPLYIYPALTDEGKTPRGGGPHSILTSEFCGGDAHWKHIRLPHPREGNRNVQILHYSNLSCRA